MNFLNLIQNAYTIKTGDIIKSWSEVGNDQAKFKLELNNSLNDLWLNYDYIFKNRDITMTCVAGQNNYDLPFNGKLKQNGLLLQTIDNKGIPTGDKTILRYSYHLEKFFQSTQQGQPYEFCISGNELLLYPTPDKAYTITCLYETNQWALSVCKTNNISNFGQNVLYVDDVTDKNVGDIIFINKGNSTEETGIIQSIQTNSLTFVGNLTFTHQIGERVTKEKQDLTYENDEPNFPSEYHNILEYAVLVRLFYNDQIRQVQYTKLFGDAMGNLISGSKKAIDGGERIFISECKW